LKFIKNKKRLIYFLMKGYFSIFKNNQPLSLLFLFSLLNQTIPQIYSISLIFLSYYILSPLFLSFQFLLTTKHTLRVWFGFGTAIIRNWWLFQTLQASKIVGRSLIILNSRSLQINYHLEKANHQWMAKKSKTEVLPTNFWKEGSKSC